MKSKLPIKNLVQLNILVALVMSGYVYFFLMIDERQKNGLLYAVMTLITILMIGLVNTFIATQTNRRHPFGYNKIKIIKYSISYLSSATLYFVVWLSFSLLIKSPVTKFDTNTIRTLLVSSLVVNTLILSLQNLILLQHEKSLANMEIRTLKFAHSEAAYQLLKQQIQPHFLFNSLNTLKSLYRKDITKGDGYIVRLAAFLRASIYHNNTTISTLEQEVNLLDDYIEMQKIRFDIALDCQIDIPKENLQKYFLPSFSLQPLVENAIKHNELTDEQPLKISISQVDDRVIVRNNLQMRKRTEVSSNSGLMNLNERYRLWSGDEIIINSNEKEFIVSIKLLEHEYSNHRR